MKQRGSAATVAALLLALTAACAHPSTAPVQRVWGLPVYPGAVETGKSTAAASFVRYRTDDALDDVYFWYIRRLPAGTPHAYSALKKQATFALFDARELREIHLATEGASTTILMMDRRM